MLLTQPGLQRRPLQQKSVRTRRPRPGSPHVTADARLPLARASAQGRSRPENRVATGRTTGNLGAKQS